VLWVQSPTGMPATHGSCKWIRRQESDLRGLRSERSWDASNPHLSNWRASKELHPTFGLWRPVPRYEDRPNLAERGEPESHAACGTVCFPDSPRTLPGSRSEMAEGGRSRSTHPRGCHSFSKRGCAPAHFTFQCWQRLSESNAHDPKRIIVGFRPTKHATCEPLGLAESGPVEGHAERTAPIG
jgi:hypothetical protein